MISGSSKNSTLVTGSSGALTAKEQRAGKRESVRSTIALYYVLGYFLIITLSMVIGWYLNYEVESFKDFLVTISGVLSGPLGFIIGYYFKESSIEPGI